jgi:Zn-dependent metalloprotease
MAKAQSIQAKTEMHPTYKVPRRFYDIDEPPSDAEPRRIAEAILQKIAGDLQIESDLSQVRFDQVRESLLGKHVLFQQQHDGQPITGAWVRIDIDQSGRVYNIQNDLIPQKLLGKKVTARAAAIVAPGAPLSKEQATQKALEATGATAQTPYEVVAVEEVMFPVNGVPTAAWKVVVVHEKPRGEWKVYIDRAAGVVLDKVSLLKEQDGRGRVFDPNPVVTLNDPALEDTSPIPDAAYMEVTLHDLDNNGHLDGPFVSTRNTQNRVQRANFDFRFKRPDRAFKEVMVYFHIDRVQRYIQELGFDNVLNQPIAVNTDGIPDDNSFYSPLTKALTFGTGGVDDAEDAEIILHEYGHAIQDNQVPGFGATNEGGAMGEGFGDYLAASFFADSKPDAMRPTLGNWDAVFYSGANPPCLRRLDSNKLYPRDIHGEVHDDGEIWSACLWQIRAALGGPTADRLVLAHHFLLTPQSGFEDAAKALLTTDEQLNASRNTVAIRDVFIRRGILPNPQKKGKRAGVRFADTGSNATRRPGRKGK